MNSRFFEIENEIDTHLQAIFALQTEKQTLIQSSFFGKENEVSLSFDDNVRTIRWNCGSVRLSPKPYLFIKILWNAPQHRAKIETIEQKVWKRKKGDKKEVTIKTKIGIKKVTIKSKFVPKGTLFSLVCRLQKALKNSRFPYKILSLKNFSTQETRGFALKCNDVAKKMQTITKTRMVQ
ncbi:MAG: hypothetical protein LBU65_06710 [Planctomycetaceae bacterium]|jgi:hypothetical protein|nr:hypothetical protein [Planctomycetaceae bacterium]